MTLWITTFVAAIFVGARYRSQVDAHSRWVQRCLMAGLVSPKVARQLQEWYADAEKRRYESIAQRINETLEANQVGLLVISQDHQVQFPEDVRVFYVAPPALNDISRWLREHSPAAAPQDTPDAEEPPPDPDEATT